MTQPSIEVIQEQESLRQTKRRMTFRDGNRVAHVQALYEWLYPDLRDLPGIAWDRMPSQVIGYFINTVRDSVYAPHIALALGVTLGYMEASSLRTVSSSIHRLLVSIQTHCETWNGRDLTREVWEEYATKTKVSSARRNQLRNYATVTDRYLTDYVEQLNPTTRMRIAPYVLPRLPGRFLGQHSGAAIVNETAQRRRKEKSDVLVPLHTVLVALIQFRKQAMQRLVHAFRDARKRVEAGETLPLSFSYEESLPEMNRNARTVAEFQIMKRPVKLQFILWNCQTWIEHHPDDGKWETRHRAKQRTGFYSPENDQFFLEYIGEASDFLWCGDLLAYGLLQHLHMVKKSLQTDFDESQAHRVAYARKVGAPDGFACECSGILTPAGGFGAWLARRIRRFGTMLFDPEALYRGTLFGTALATLALTNGSRMCELLQVSSDRFKAHLYEEKINGQPTGKQRVLWLQYLLPKGRRNEAERQLFPISPQSYELLREIATLLRETYGCIPKVRPHPSNVKSEGLKPERYLFQWSALSNKRDITFCPSDVCTLIRFVLHGLEFRTKQGEPFWVSTHLLRHVMATTARHEYDIPAEAIAYVLHHRQTDCTLPTATQYYSQMTEEQRLTALADFMFDVEEQSASIVLSMPDERSLEQMDEDLRDVFERWHTLLETTFGFCGRVGLCPRGYNRSLCIGCPYLVPDPRKRDSASKWRESYMKQAQELEREGATVDAHQVRLQIQELDDLLNSMAVIQQAIEDGSRKPVFLQLPAALYNEVIIDAKA